MITRITIQNIKETLCETIKLAKNTILTGDWGSGKTTVLDAVQVGALGKMLSEDFKGAGLAPIVDGLCTGGKDEMSVAIVSDKLSFMRKFERKNGKYSQGIEVPDENLKGVQKCTPVIDEVFGNSIFDVRVLRDNPEYVKEILLSHCKIDDRFSTSEIPQKIITALADEFINPGYIETAGEFIPDKKELFKTACAKLSEKGVPVEDVTSGPYWKKKDNEDIFAFVARLIENIIEKRKETARDVLSQKKALQAMSKIESSQTPTGNISVLRSEIDTFEKNLSEMHYKLSTTESTNNRYDFLENQLKNFNLPEDDLEKVKAQKKELEIQIAKAEQLKDIHSEKLTEIRIKAERYRNNQERIAEIERKCTAIAEEMESAPKIKTAMPENSVAVLENIIKKDYLCSHCELITYDILDEVKAGTDNRAVAGELQKRIDTLLAEKKLLQNENGATAIGDLEDLTGIVEAHQKDLAELHKKRDEIMTLINQIEKYSAIYKELSGIAKVDIREYNNLIKGMQTVLTEKRNQLEQMVEVKAEKSNYQKHQLELTVSEIKTKMFTVTETALKSFYNDMVNFTLQPVCVNVNKGLKEISADWNFYIEMDGRGRLVFGINKNVKGVNGIRIKTPYRALSGAESVFTRNILGAVLLSYSDSVEKILIDEIAEVPVITVPHFLNTMSRMAGENVQCIYATCHKCEVPANWLEIPRGTQSTKNVECNQQKVSNEAA